MTDRARRAFLGRCASAATLIALPAAAAEALQRDELPHLPSEAGVWPELLGAWNRGAGYYAGRWTAEQGVRGIALPFRAHAVLADPFDADQCIVIARRPGDLMMRIDVLRGRKVALVKAEPTRILNGHAAFSPDGRTLYTTESDVVDGMGWIGVRDSVTLDTLATYATRGMDPHVVLLEPGGTLLVANGGILTLPHTGLGKLDVKRMDPSLVRIDVHDGRITGEWRLPDPCLSIRHLARAPNGCVGIALQGQHEESRTRENAPVFAWFDGISLHLADKPEGLNLRGYGGDVVCIAASGSTLFAVSCTHAGVVAWWDDSGSWLGAVQLKNACALVTWGSALIAAGEDGDLVRIETPGFQSRAHRVPALHWDNHMAMRQPGPNPRAD